MKYIAPNFRKAIPAGPPCQPMENVMLLLDRILAANHNADAAAMCGLVGVLALAALTIAGIVAILVVTL
jgi:hypothetical protein